MKEKRIWRAAALLCAVVLAAGCGSRQNSNPTGADDGNAQAGNAQTGNAQEPDDRLNVVTTVFPYYDFTRQIAGDRVELSMVVPAGMDSHSFEPTPADMRRLQEADLLIRNGGEMEHWLDEALNALEPEHLTVITMMDYVEVYEEESVEGMEDSHDHSHGEDVVDHDGHEMEIEYDEHIWTSPVTAQTLAHTIEQTLCAMDPAGSPVYESRGAAYQDVLKQLDEGFLQVSEDRKRNKIVVGDKFPFRYLAETYGLDYRAAFSGCSSDSEPSAKTIAYLIDKVREEQIPVVYYLELSSSRVAEIIAEETGAEPLLLHSCHNVTRGEFDRGVTYQELMEHNIEVLRKGLDE